MKRQRFHKVPNPSPDLPSTPPPQLRPFERLAGAGGDLAYGCWMWVPLTIGMPGWPYVGGPLALVAALGAWWRMVALRAINGSIHASRPRAWQTLATTSGLVGLVQGGSTCLRGLGLGLPELPWLLAAWLAITLFEIGVAMLWVLRGSWERRSRWMIVPLGLAGILMVAGLGAQSLAISAQDAPKWVSALLFTMVALGGVAGPMLVGDGASRLAASLCAESLDEETEAAASASWGGRTPRD